MAVTVSTCAVGGKRTLASRTGENDRGSPAGPTIESHSPAPIFAIRAGEIVPEIQLIPNEAQPDGGVPAACGYAITPIRLPWRFAASQSVSARSGVSKPVRRVPNGFE